MWIARDYNNSLFVYRSKPKKDTIHGVWEAQNFDFFQIYDESNKWAFPNVKWSDDEPTEVKLVKK